jgi:hypothetical protein
MGCGTRFHLGAGTSGFKNRSMSKFQLEMLERALDEEPFPCWDDSGMSEY